MMSKNDTGSPSRAASMLPPSCFPLMTPSASPPVQRPFGRFSSAAPGPAKKRRVSRAPSMSAPSLRSFSVTSASSSSASPAFNFDASVDPGEELHTARRASSSRVLDIWSQLAQKYAKRIDEDDIIDLRKESIIKDRGVLRSSGDMFEIGYFATERKRAERLDNGLPLTPADDEPDELDAFADVPDNTSRSETDVDEDDGFELAQQTKRLPPVRELDPADAADLADFLRAEQMRKETFGDPDEDDEEDEGEEEEEFDEEQDVRVSEAREEERCKGEGLRVETVASSSDVEEVTDREARLSGDEEEFYQESVHGLDDDGPSHNDYSRLSTPSGSPEFDILEISNPQNEPNTRGSVVDSRSPEGPIVIDLCADSEDELGGWDHDEGSTVYSVTGFNKGFPDGENRGVAELPPRTRSSAVRSKQQEKLLRGISQNIPPKKSPKTRRRSRTPSRKRAPVPQSPSPTVIQLQTPPRSTSLGPEPCNRKVTTTYSRKKRGLSSSPKKTPMRIQSTESNSSHLETETTSILPKSPKQNQQSHSHVSPVKKVKLIPEVLIDVPRPSPVKESPKKQSPVRESHLGSPSRHVKHSLREKTATLKGKAKATKVDGRTSPVGSDVAEKPYSPSPEILELHVTPRSHRKNSLARAVSPKRLSTLSKKREHSPILDKSVESESVIDVVMASPNRSAFRSTSRRASSSRRSLVSEIDSHDECEPGPSSRSSKSRRSRSRPSGEQVYESNSSPYPAPELPTFSFTPSYPPSNGYPNYAGPHLPHFSHQQNPVAVPNLQDPNAQYHLAQALQSLSILMGGALPFPPSPVNPSQLPHPSRPLGQQVPQPWQLYTPRRHSRSMDFDTPQSVATAPPSSPLGSDYSDSIPSSPTKQAMRSHSRYRSQSQTFKTARPKSAIRDSTTPSRTRSRSVRRVSFSSPEATQIEDNAYEYVSDNPIEFSGSDGEDSDFVRRRQRREEQSSRSLQLQTPRRHVRAQTPGPPESASIPEVDYRPSLHNKREPRRRISEADRPVEAPNQTRRKGHR